jgi:hypothetical protein
MSSVMIEWISGNGRSHLLSIFTRERDTATVFGV